MPYSEALFARQRTIRLIGTIAAELLGIAVVIARSARLAQEGEPAALVLADIACAAAEQRLSALWPQLAAEASPRGSEHAAIGTAWLSGTGLGFLRGDAVHYQPSDSTTTPEVEPLDAAEAAITAIWCELFGLEKIGRHDDFYELGGHSLLAIRIVSRLRSDLGVKVPVRVVLENPTVAGVVDAAGLRGKDIQGMRDQLPW